jgi:threonylcarbamoyladenosine tRNA methylthiotransferase MtaB
MAFARAHIFRFSPRAHTPAAALPGLDTATIAARAEALRRQTDQDRAQWQHSCTGRLLEVVVESVDGQTGLARGTSREYLSLSFPAAHNRPGTLVRVRYCPR